MWWVRRRARWGIFREAGGGRKEGGRLGSGGWVGEVWEVDWNIMVGFWRWRWRLRGDDGITSASVFFRPGSPSGNASAKGTPTQGC